ncbi:hypothetical protein [Methanosphaera sp. BMS]|nr:hypothetical protein [Methanosphaera sp. BMS]
MKQKKITQHITKKKPTPESTPTKKYPTPETKTLENTNTNYTKEDSNKKK